MRARAGLRRGRFMAGSRAAERGFDSNYEAASQVLIKREPREGGPETPRPKIKVGGRGGQAPGPTPRPAPAQRGKPGGGGGARQSRRSARAPLRWRHLSPGLSAPAQWARRPSPRKRIGQGRLGAPIVVDPEPLTHGVGHVLEVDDPHRGRVGLRNVHIPAVLRKPLPRLRAGAPLRRAQKIWLRRSPKRLKSQKNPRPWRAVTRVGQNAGA